MVVQNSSFKTIFMAQPKSYCEAVEMMEDDSVHRVYHDTAYGFPIENDNELFERLILEINQAGLSWTTILKKQDNFRKAFHGFEIEKVAGYKETDRERLLNDAGIIRNRRKVDATIHNANVVLDIQKEFGSFKNWLDHHHPKPKEEWVKLFRKTFKFTGGEIVNEFLMSTGYLPGAHIESCPVYHKILKHGPSWAQQ
jgi:DNA-3-methyladenine glycosylase I